MNYLLNTWYMAAWLEDLKVAGHMSLTVAEYPLLLIRATDGSVSALLDRCPHRFAPLSRGRIGETTVTCGYHGIAFDFHGKCVANPHGPCVAALQVPKFPAHVVHNAVWVWLGDPALADPALICDLGLIDRTVPTAQTQGREFIAANYQLCIDNILDLSHADYLHPNSLGGGATTRAKVEIKEHGNEIVVRWRAYDDVTPPALDALMPKPGQRCDLHIEVRWSAPGLMVLTFGATPTGQPEQAGPETYGIHIMTPQDAGHTHYFFWNARNCRTEDGEFNEFVRKMLLYAFAGEDKPMLEAQQLSIGDRAFESLRPALLRTDEGSMRVRRRLGAMIAAERSAAIIDHAPISATGGIGGGDDSR